MAEERWPSGEPMAALEGDERARREAGEPACEPMVKPMAGAEVAGVGTGEPKSTAPNIQRLAAAATNRSRVQPLPKARILKPDEYSKALLISHNRRDPAALNATYAFVRALRHQLDPETSLPFCPYCYVGPDGRARTPATYELWADKEQLAGSAGADWQEPIVRAMMDGVATIVFIGNAFCGSHPCLDELRFADQERLPLIPVFLEGAHSSQADFDGWLQSRGPRPGHSGVPEGVISSPEMQQFREWRVWSGMGKFVVGKKQVCAKCLTCHRRLLAHNYVLAGGRSLPQAGADGRGIPLHRLSGHPGRGVRPLHRLGAAAGGALGGGAQDGG